MVVVFGVGGVVVVVVFGFGVSWRVVGGVVDGRGEAGGDGVVVEVVFGSGVSVKLISEIGFSKGSLKHSLIAV